MLVFDEYSHLTQTGILSKLCRYTSVTMSDRFDPTLYQPHVLAGSGGRRQRGRRRPGPPKPYGAFPWYSTWLIDQGPFEVQDESGQWIEGEGPAAIVLPPYQGDRIKIPVISLFSWVEWGVKSMPRVPRLGGVNAEKYPEGYEQPSPEDFFGQSIPIILPDSLRKPTQRMTYKVNAFWWRKMPQRLIADAELAIWLARLLTIDRQPDDVENILPECSETFRTVVNQLASILDLGVNIQEWSAAVELHPRTLARRCMDECGLRPKQIMNLLRRERAQRMLLHSSANIPLVAKSSGFETREAFTHWFTLEFGDSPVRWRDEQNSA